MPKTVSADALPIKENLGPVPSLRLYLFRAAVIELGPICAR